MDDTAGRRPCTRRQSSLGSASAHANLGILYASEGKYEDAVRSYLEAVKNDPGSALLYHNLGDRLFAPGKRERAPVAAFRRALELGQAQLRVNPRDAKALARLAVVESRLGRQPGCGP